MIRGQSPRGPLSLRYRSADEDEEDTHIGILNPLFPPFPLAAASRRPVQIFLCVLLCRQQTNAESAGGLIRRGGHPTPNIEHRINSEAMNNGNVFPTHFHTHPRKNILDIFATFRVMGAKGIPASDHQITVSVS